MSHELRTRPLGQLKQLHKCSINNDVMVVRRGGLQIHNGFCIELKTTYVAPNTHIQYRSDARYNSFETACNFVYILLHANAFASACKLVCLCV